MKNFFLFKTIMILSIIPFFYLAGLTDTSGFPNTRNPHRFHQHGMQPRIFINQGLDYRGYYGLPTSTTVRGNTIIQNYYLPPQRRLEFPSPRVQNTTPAQTPTYTPPYR